MNFASTADKYPSEREALGRLEDLLSKQPAVGTEYTLTRLCDLLHPHSQERLASALGDLVRQGVFKLKIRVISPFTQGGIKDFDSLEEIPPSIHDWRSDSELEVTSENLRVLYKPSAHLYDNSRAEGGN